MSEEARADGSSGAGVLAGAVAVASGRENAACPRRDDREHAPGVGQEGDAAAHSLHGDDQVCGGDGEQSRRPTPTRPTPGDGPTAIPPGTGGPCHVLYGAPERITR